MDDSRIVELYLSRDETAVAHTAEKFGSRLRALSYGIVRDHQTAEECENDTYLEAWNSIPPHEPRSYLYSFLLRITRHLSLNCCRNRSRLKRRAFLCELNKMCIRDSMYLSRFYMELYIGQRLRSSECFRYSFTFQNVFIFQKITPLPSRLCFQRTKASIRSSFNNIHLKLHIIASVSKKIV